MVGADEYTALCRPPVNGHILQNNLAIWSHCASMTSRMRHLHNTIMSEMYLGTTTGIFNLQERKINLFQWLRFSKRFLLFFLHLLIMTEKFFPIETLAFSSLHRFRVRQKELLILRNNPALGSPRFHVPFEI